MTTGVPSTPGNEPRSAANVDPGADRCSEKGGRHLSRAQQGIVGVIALVVAAFVFVTGRLCAVPGPLEFWKVTAQPLGVVTAGLLAVLAAGITFRAQRRSSDSAAESARKDREKDIRAEALDRCWTRFLWLTGDSDGRDELPFEVELKLSSALSEEAALWEDEALVLFIAGYAGDLSTDVRSLVEENR